MNRMIMILMVALVALGGTCYADSIVLYPNGDHQADLYPVPTQAHYLNVKDWSDDNYNGSIWAGVIKRDLYTLDNHASASGVINSVTVWYRMQTTSSSYGRHVLYTNGTIIEGEVVQPETPTTLYKTYNTNPVTGNPWT